MNRQKTINYLRQCVVLAATPSPTTWAERRDHARRVAEEDHRAELRRQPVPQLELRSASR